MTRSGQNGLPGQPGSPSLAARVAAMMGDDRAGCHHRRGQQDGQREHDATGHGQAR
jgi:hypothetical protein